MSIIQSLPQLPPTIARHALHALTAALPPAAANTDMDREARDAAAVAALVALQPADEFETLLAAQIVGAHAHAMDAMRLAMQPDQTPEQVHRCRAQAIAMMRQMHSGLRAMLQRRAGRDVTSCECL